MFARRVRPKTGYPAGKCPQGTGKNGLPCGYRKDQMSEGTDEIRRAEKERDEKRGSEKRGMRREG